MPYIETNINLRTCLIESAQCFSWLEGDNGFIGWIGIHPVRVSQKLCGIEYEGCEEEEIRAYFDLKRDYKVIRQRYEAYPIVREAMQQYEGLRVLHQDPWSALVSFILSANNNVSRITKLYRSICEYIGTETRTPYGTLFSLPMPEVLAKCTEEELRTLGVGYRAPYLIGTAQAVRDGFPLERLSEMGYKEAREALIKLPGVGPKVADCVLLFGCGHTEAFPVDVWMERVLREWFGFKEKSRGKLEEKAKRIFGADAGIVQQFLFHAARVEKTKANSD